MPRDGLQRKQTAAEMGRPESQKRSAQVLEAGRPFNNDLCPKAIGEAYLDFHLES